MQKIGVKGFKNNVCLECQFWIFVLWMNFLLFVVKQRYVNVKQVTGTKRRKAYTWPGWLLHWPGQRWLLHSPPGSWWLAGCPLLTSDVGRRFRTQANLIWISRAPPWRRDWEVDRSDIVIARLTEFLFISSRHGQSAPHSYILFSCFLRWSHAKRIGISRFLINFCLGVKPSPTLQPYVRK